MLDLSKVWPEWKAVEKVGEGSFGKVFKCEREEYGISSVSAIKVISIPQSKAELESMSFEGVTEEGARTYFSEIVNDFANEIKLMEMLKGAPNVVAVENYKIVERADEIGWDIYIRMEYLQSFVAYSKNKKFTEAEVKKFALDISNALDICSKNGVIHRDVKPDNIFVDKFGSFKLGDFGVARRLEGSMSMMSKKGTYSYMAPEVFRGEKYDHRADIYSLGMVMYKLLNRNRDPFIDPEKPVVSFKERNESLERRRRGERLPAPIDASPEMASVILRACEFRPEDRYLTVDDFRNAILSVGARIINDEPTTKLFEDKTIVVAPKVFEFDETEPAAMTANPSANYSDEPTVFADEEATVMAGDEPTMIDEPTAFAQDVTCMADEPTVFAQDVTVFDDGNEPTVFADDEATVMAEPEHKRVGYAIASNDETAKEETEEESDEEDNKDSDSKEDPKKEPQKKSKAELTGFWIAVLIVVIIGIVVAAYWVSRPAPSTDNGSYDDLNYEDGYYEEEYYEEPETELITLSPEEELYLQAEQAISDGDIPKAAMLFGSLGDYADARERSFELWKRVPTVSDTLSAGGWHTVALKSNGTAVAIGFEESNGYTRCDVGYWSDMIAVSAGNWHTVGIKSNGTVVAVGNNSNGQCDVDDWTNIIAVDAGYWHTVGLKSDGTVVATEWFANDEDDTYEGQCDVYSWSDIVAVSAGEDFTVGLKSDGTVVVVGDDGYYQSYVEDWTDIVAIEAGDYYIVGLKSDGTVVSTSYSGSVESWSDITAISAGFNGIIGLKSDGTVVSVGYFENGEGNVDSWTNIVAVSTYKYHTVGLKSDGTVIATQVLDDPDNEYDTYHGQCDVGGWTNIRQP